MSNGTPLVITQSGEHTDDVTSIGTVPVLPV